MWWLVSTIGIVLMVFGLSGLLYCCIFRLIEIKKQMSFLKKEFKKEFEFCEADWDVEDEEDVEEAEEDDRVPCVSCGCTSRIETCWGCWNKLEKEHDELLKKLDKKEYSAIDHVEVISEPGACIKVERITLKPEVAARLVSHSKIELKTQK